ncbi:MAG: hypothetical protein FJ022_02725 [Chloroflexi bacterium]|nr:hypothetical protein [Chloroflexota bacterium]MBM4449706.1 hypothetical protein [Chloroflexota bacterium]
MSRIVRRFGKLITASFFVMGIGVLAFLLTPLLYGLWGIDSDLPGILILVIGLVIFIIGIIRRKQPHGWKLVLLAILSAVLCLPILSFIVSLIYYLITGKAIG